MKYWPDDIFLAWWKLTEGTDYTDLKTGMKANWTEPAYRINEQTPGKKTTPTNSMAVQEVNEWQGFGVSVGKMTVVISRIYSSIFSFIVVVYIGNKTRPFYPG